MNKQITKLEPRELAEARDLPEITTFINKAEAFRQYAKKISKNLELQNYFAEWKLRGQRKAGQTLKDIELDKGGRPSKNQLHDETSLKLKDLGLTKITSFRLQKIAELSQSEFENIIRITKDKLKELTTALVLNAVRKKEHLERFIEPVKLPEGEFNVIYADPPWQYNNSGFEESAETKYPTMSMDELFDMAEKLNSIIASPSVLFLWVTNPFLKEGISLCEAWSFNYKTELVWIKDKGPSIGWFALSRHEHLFIATRGDGMHPVKKPISWFKAPVTKHSKKPDLIYKLIEEMYPRQKYLELFARNKREGWQSWGDEL